MVASLLRVLHSGVQDGRLLPPKGQPNISLFSKVFVRAGRFTTQWVRLDFDSAPNFGGSNVLTIPRKGHLLSRLFLVTTLPDIATVQNQAASAAGALFAGPHFGWTNSVGHALINETSFEIGGARIERIDGRLLEVMDEFYSPLEKQISMNKLLHRKDNGFSYNSFGINDTPSTIVTPLPFWFSCGDSGLALPVDAIQADSMKLYVTFNNINSLYVSSAQVPLPTTLPAGGDAYFPLSNAVFYANNPAGSNVAGLTGNPKITTKVTQIPGVQMPTNFNLSSYILAEYIYLDKPEAYRFRLSDIRVPIVQHYPFDPYDSQNLSKINYKFSVPNPTRNLFFYLNHYDAVRFNAPFLATRDLSSSSVPIAPWWPDASGMENPQHIGNIRAGFSSRESEPLSSIALMYEGKLIRYATDAPSFFRSILPSLEMRKSPWVNRYYYTLMFGFQHGILAPSLPSGAANLDKMLNIELQLTLHPNTGSLNPNNVNRFHLHLWAETYNILRIYGGRAGLLFGY